MERSVVRVRETRRGGEKRKKKKEAFTFCSNQQLRAVSYNLRHMEMIKAGKFQKGCVCLCICLREHKEPLFL